MKHTPKRIQSIFAAATLTVCALPQQIVLKANAAGTVKLSGNTLTLSGAFTKEQLDAYCSSNAVTSTPLTKNGERSMSRLTASSTHCWTNKNYDTMKRAISCPQEAACLLCMPVRLSQLYRHFAHHCRGLPAYTAQHK